MKLTLGRRQHHSAPDFEQQRADVEQGRQNLIEAYQGYVDETMADESLSGGEKRLRLEVYKAELEQAEVECQAELRRIEAEEARQLAETYGVPPEEEGAAAEADAYCAFGEGQDGSEQLAPEEPALENDGLSC